MNDDSVMEHFNISEKYDCNLFMEEKLKQVKGLTKQQLQILSTMPTPVITVYQSGWYDSSR